MPIAIDPDRAIPYVLKAERGKANATTFLLKPLCGSDAKLGIRLGLEPQGRAEGIYDIARIALSGWSGFCDEAGVEVPFALEEQVVQGRRRKVASESSMQRLDAAVIGELADAAIDYATLSANDVRS